jgi:hypothetical protein
VAFVRGKGYAGRRRPSIDPVVFFMCQLVLFVESLRSELKLVETVNLHLVHRRCLAYALDEALLDHSSLTRIRQRLGIRSTAPVPANQRWAAARRPSELLLRANHSPARSASSPQTPPVPNLRHAAARLPAGTLRPAAFPCGA